MNIAILDLGTNVFHLIIVSYPISTGEGAGGEAVFKLNIPVKLGEGGINKNYIVKIAYERGQNALKIFSEEIKKFNAEKVFAFATSAIRTANNGQQFCDDAENNFGIKIKMIDGNEEAELIYKGVRETVNFDDDFLLMDIGGGSVEFIIGNKKNIHWKQSFAIGAARLRDNFHTTEPITDVQLSELKKYLHNELQPLKDALEKFPTKKLVGAAGAFETFLYMKKMHNEKQNFYKFSIENFHEIYNDLIFSTDVKRAEMFGLTGFRIDMIVMAVSLVEFVLQNFSINEFYISTHALKEGIMCEVIK